MYMYIHINVPGFISKIIDLDSIIWPDLSLALHL